MKLNKLIAAMSFSAALLVLAAASSAALAADAVEPFNGKSLDGWALKGPAERSKWTVGTASLDKSDPGKIVAGKAAEGQGELINASGQGVDAYTKDKWGDCLIELEVMVPKGSNSGIYLQGEYEVQVLDSFGKDKVGPGDLGGLYGAQAPRVNAAKAPGEWQKFVIDFTAPKFEGGKKVANARFNKVTLNGQVIHENVEMKGPTPSGVTGKEAATGPLMLQGDHGPVAYRNIRVTPK